MGKVSAATIVRLQKSTKEPCCCDQEAAIVLSGLINPTRGPRSLELAIERRDRKQSSIDLLKEESWISPTPAFQPYVFRLSITRANEITTAVAIE
jgi:hypothetical protein